MSLYKKGDVLVNIKKGYEYFVKWHDDLYGMLYLWINSAHIH